MLAVEPQIVEQYARSGKVSLVFRDVLNHGERSERASEAAACAGRQGYFWDMHALLFENQDNVWAASKDELLEVMFQFGDQIEGLETASYRQCLQERSTLPELQAADAEQRERGITSQPIFEIGDQRLFGLQSYEAMSAWIEEALK